MASNQKEQFEKQTNSQEDNDFYDEMLLTPDKCQKFKQSYGSASTHTSSNSILIPLSDQKDNVSQFDTEQNSKKKQACLFETSSKFGIFQHEPLMRKTWKSDDVISEEEREDECIEEDNLLGQQHLKQFGVNQNHLSQEIITPAFKTLNNYQIIQDHAKLIQQPHIIKKTLALEFLETMTIYPQHQKKKQRIDVFVSPKKRQLGLTKPATIFRFAKQKKKLSICHNFLIKINKQKENKQRNYSLERNFSLKLNEVPKKVDFSVQQGQRYSNKITPVHCLNQFQYFPKKIQQKVESKNIQTDKRYLGFNSNIVKHEVRSKAKVQFGQQTDSNFHSIGMGTEKKANNIEKCLNMNLGSQYNFEVYLQKISQNFQALLLQLIENQKLHTESKIKGVNTSIQCSEREISRKSNLKRQSVENKQSKKKANKKKSKVQIFEEGQTNLININDDEYVGEAPKKRVTRRKKYE